MRRRIDVPRVYRWMTALNIGIGLGYLARFWSWTRRGLIWTGDFTAYYTGAYMVRKGLGSQLYNFALQAQCQQQFLGDRSFPGGLLPYIMPPHFALLMTPFAYLPLESAFWAWFGMNLLALVAVVGLMLFWTKDWLPRERWLFVSVLLAFPPLRIVLILGTSSLIALLLMLVVYSAFRLGKPWLGAVGLALGTIRPQALLPLGLFYLLQRRWRFVAVCGIVSVSLLCLVALVMGPGIWFDYLLSLTNTAQLYNAGGVFPEAMHNLRGLLALVLGAGRANEVNALSWMGFAAYVLFAVWLWRARARVNVLELDLRLALGMVLGLFFSFHLQFHDTLVLTLPLLIVLQYLVRGGRMTTRLWVLIGLVPVLLLLYEETLQVWTGLRSGVVIVVVTSAVLAKLIVEERSRQRELFQSEVHQAAEGS